MSSVLDLERKVQDTINLLDSARPPAADERELLQKRMFVFLSIEPKSLAQVIEEHRKHFRLGSRDYARSEPFLTNYVPPAMEIAINPLKPILPHNVNFADFQDIPTATLTSIIDDYSQSVHKDFPHLQAIMPFATILAQADVAYSTRTYGQSLLRNDCLARTLDPTTDDKMINVGRVRGLRGSDRLQVGNQYMRLDKIFPPGNWIRLTQAVPVIVFV